MTYSLISKNRLYKRSDVDYKDQYLYYLYTSKMIIKSTADWTEINLNRDDEKTKSIQRRLIIDNDNNKKSFTI